MGKKYPRADLRLLGQQTQGRMKKHDIICLHTMVGYLASTDTMFRKNGFGGTESHFGIGGIWGSDSSRGLNGKVYQWQDLDFTADANLDGNHRVISIETADNAPRLAKDILPWTAKQLDEIVLLVAWLCEEFDIPPKLIPDTKPGRRGIAYHRQGCEHSKGRGVPGFLAVGGEKWSSAPGKECPGEARIKQLTDIVIPRVRMMIEGEPEEMPLTEKEMDAIATKTVAKLLSPATKLSLTAAEADNMSSAGTKRKEGDEVSFRYFLSWGGGGLYRVYDRLAELQKSFATAGARKAVSAVHGDDDVMAAPVTAPAGGVAAWSPMLRHLLILVIGVTLSWVTTVVVPFLSGQTGYGTLLAALVSAAVAYFTPLVPSYGIGKPKTGRMMRKPKD